MIACVDCGRVLLNDVKPVHRTATTDHLTRTAAQLRAARSHHTCLGGVMTNPSDQCSRCDFVAECIDREIGSLEEVAGVVGTAAPSLHVHLVQHDRDDLLRRLTYGGQPILAEDPVGEVVAPVAEVVAERSCACDAWVFDPGEDDYADAEGVLHTVAECAPVVLEVPAGDRWPEGTDPQELVDAGLVTPGEVEQADGARDAVDYLDDLCAHPDATVAGAAMALCDALLAYQARSDQRQRLADLVEQRDALNREIDDLARRLGDLPEPEPEPEVGPVAVVPVAEKPQTETQRVREWAREQGRKVNPTGRLPRELVDAYRQAHGA